jgi:hypothetical protein
VPGALVALHRVGNRHFQTVKRYVPAVERTGGTVFEVSGDWETCFGELDSDLMWASGQREDAKQRPFPQHCYGLEPQLSEFSARGFLRHLFDPLSGLLKVGREVTGFDYPALDQCNVLFLDGSTPELV